MREAVDVAIVGGGIAGGALASALAHDGLEVVVLEASERYEDRVRGESLMPWGVAEARGLGVEKLFLDAGARVSAAWVHYDDDVPPDISVANPIPAGMMLPGIPGSLNLRHPEACSALREGAQAAGVRFLTGVSDVTLQAGTRPTVTAIDRDGMPIELGARLIVGADGRNSTVRRQVGIELSRHEATNMVGGVILEGDGLCDDHDFLASSDELFMASFRQHDRQLRVYLCPSVEQKGRFSGPHGISRFLREANFKCLPFGEAISNATPIGPLATYPGDDTWTTTPFAPGVVLVGDAAGWNNPIIGQGLSIALRDVRMVRDQLRDGGWGTGAFEAYALERIERMRRLRTAAMTMAAAMTDEADNRPARRAKFLELQQTEPLMAGLMMGIYGGPENAPPEAVDGRLQKMIEAA